MGGGGGESHSMQLLRPAPFPGELVCKLVCMRSCMACEIVILVSVYYVAVAGPLISKNDFIIIMKQILIMWHDHSNIITPIVVHATSVMIKYGYGRGFQDMHSPYFDVHSSCT